MKNGSNETLEAKVAERAECAKKLYRYVTDVARRVGEMTAASQSIGDLFSTHLEVQRQKLRDNCEKLLFFDALNYGKKSLELLWRKVYYETVSTAKKLRETDSENDSYLFTHIVCGIGHFHHFISRIEADMKVQFKEVDYTCLQQSEDYQEKSVALMDDEMQFGRSTLHSCLIYLGDLSRYQVEIFNAFEPSIAARYYLQAAHVDMSSGMPYNQLGNLYLDKNYNLDSVCYYIQCLSCASPFEGAMGNLTKIFEKNTQFSDTINNSETLTQSEHIQNVAVNFLSLIEIWYLSKNDTNIPQRCSTITQELKIAMDFIKHPLPDINKNYNEYTQAVDEENCNPSYLNANLLHKIVLICLFTITKVTEVDESKAFACKAFTLALLSQLLQKLLKQLQSFGLVNPASKYISRHTLHQSLTEKIDEEIKAHNDNTEVETATNGIVHNGEENKNPTKKIPTNDKEILQNGDAKGISKKSLAKRRTRRRRITSSESSDMSDGDTESSDIETYESCSDEDLSDSTCHSDECLSEDSAEVSDAEDKVKQSNGIAEENVDKLNQQKNINGVKQNNSENESKDTCGTNNLDIQGLQNFLLGDNYLSSIKLLQDWALNEKDLILSCGDSGESLFQCVVDLLNIFTFYLDSKNKENTGVKNCNILEYIRSLANKFKLEYKSVPLPEDINLRGTNICKFDKDAAEWQILEKHKLSFYEENVIRIQHFVDFGNQIVKLIPRIRFNRALKVFYLKKIPHPKVNTKISHKRSKEWHNSKTPHVESSEGGLLQRLGRLWLTSQVRELERSGQSPVPAFLVLDSAALNKHLRHIKQLLRARNFVLLIPTVVLQELDNLKREQSTARDAIRWLELQLRSGSRFVRAQRPGQSKPLPLLKYPRKAPAHIHNFIHILEFCNHFLGDDKQGGNGDPDSSLQCKSTPLLILLVGHERGNDEEQYKEFSVIGAAQSAGITVEHIGDFYAKWRQAVHKNGKKR